MKSIARVEGNTESLVNDGSFWCKRHGTTRTSPVRTPQQLVNMMLEAKGNSEDQIILNLSVRHFNFSKADWDVYDLTQMSTTQFDGCQSTGHLTRDEIRRQERENRIHQHNLNSSNLSGPSVNFQAPVGQGQTSGRTQQFPQRCFFGHNDFPGNRTTESIFTDCKFTANKHVPIQQVHTFNGQMLKFPLQ